MFKFSCQLVLLHLPLLCIPLMGCDSSPQQRAFDPADKMTPPYLAFDASHTHARGIHGGVIATLGREEYHVEAVVERDDTIEIFTSGSDPSRVLEVDAQELTAYVKPDDPGDGRQTAVIVLRPEPLAGDAEGKTSHFVGTLPAGSSERLVEISIPNLRISGERFRVQFTWDSASPPDMPVGVADAEADELYRTPGGKYTQADIHANGNTTAARKYRGFLASHDPDPQPGDRICPVTQTKANPACTWIIQGETYQFCCPPCIDEFVALAKNDPAQVAQPEAYIKK